MTKKGIEQLKQDFSKQLVGKMDYLDELWMKYASQPTQVNLEALEFHLHKLIGTTGVYGYKALSKRLRKIETQVFALEESQTDIATVGQAFHDLKNSTFEADASEVDTDIPQKTQVALIGLETDAEEQLSTDISSLGIDVKLFSTVDDFLSLSAADIDIFVGAIINQDGSSDSNYNLLKEIAQNHFIDIIYISKQNDFHTRLNAVRRHANQFFNWPAEDALVIEHVRNLAWNSGYSSSRVMIIDDSPVFANFYEAMLSKNGIDVITVTQPEQTIEKIIEHQPDLIMLDLYMPGCSGIELARIIKQHSGFRFIPIVFFSSETDPDIHAEAKSIGADDFIEKTIVPKDMIRNIKRRLRNCMQANQYIDTDPLTGLYHRRKLQAKMINLMSQFERRQSAFCCSIIDIDHFKQINDVHGHNVGDNIIRLLANMLKSSLRTNDMIFRYGGEEFVILMPETGLELARNVIDRLKEKFASTVYEVHGEQLSLSFSAGVAEYQSQHTAEALISLADECLYRAKEGGRNKVVVPSTQG